MVERSSSLVPQKTGEPLPWRERARAGVRRARITILLTLSCTSILVLSCWFGGYTCASKAETTQVVQTTSSVPVEASAAVQVDPMSAVCNLIAHGQFEKAAEDVAQMGPADTVRVRVVKEIIDQYEQIGQRRREAKEAAFKERYDELEKLKTVVDLEKPPQVAGANGYSDLEEPAPVKDPNEPNDVTDVLAVVAQATEFADSTQKAALLSDAFVTRALQKAVDHSGVLEMQGRWLDAYTNYFYWLQAIDPNNKGYSAHADELLDKASIAASFQDSPCESCSERYEGVEKFMFERAMDALNLHYVNSIDFRQMATRAIKRCNLVADREAPSKHRSRRR
jgi:hypothetical protein